MTHCWGGHPSGATHGKLAKRNPGMGPTIAAKSKRAHCPHTVHGVCRSKVAFAFQSVSRRNETNPALVPTIGYIYERHMTILGPKRSRVQLKPDRLPKLRPDLEPVQAGLDKKLADCPKGQPEILDVISQRGIGWVIFHTSLYPFVGKVIAYYTKFLILPHAILQLGVSLNFYAIDKAPAYVIGELKNASPQIRMHSPAIAKGLLRFVAERVNHIGVIGVESIHTVKGNSMLKIHIEGIQLRSWGALHPERQGALGPC